MANLGWSLIPHLIPQVLPGVIPKHQVRSNFCTLLSITPKQSINPQDQAGQSKQLQLKEFWGSVMILGFASPWNFHSQLPSVQIWRGTLILILKSLPGVSDVKVTQVYWLVQIFSPGEFQMCCCTMHISLFPQLTRHSGSAFFSPFLPPTR